MEEHGRYASRAKSEVLMKQGTEIQEGQAAFDRFKDAVKTIMAVPKVVVQKADKAAASGKKTRPKQQGSRP